MRRPAILTGCDAPRRLKCGQSQTAIASIRDLMPTMFMTRHLNRVQSSRRLAPRCPIARAGALAQPGVAPFGDEFPPGHARSKPAPRQCNPEPPCSLQHTFPAPCGTHHLPPIAPPPPLPHNGPVAADSSALRIARQRGRPRAAGRGARHPAPHLRPRRVPRPAGRRDRRGAGRAQRAGRAADRRRQEPLLPDPRAGAARPRPRRLAADRADGRPGRGAAAVGRGGRAARFHHRPRGARRHLAPHRRRRRSTCSTSRPKA